jgi:hypothetical protein
MIAREIAILQPCAKAEAIGGLSARPSREVPSVIARPISGSVQAPMPAVGCAVMLAAMLGGVPSGVPPRGGKGRPPRPNPVVKSETPRGRAEWHSMQWPMVASRRRA